MKFDLDLSDVPASISIDETYENLASILVSLRSIRDNIPHRPEILHWIEMALAEAENQLLIASNICH